MSKYVLSILVFLTAVGCSKSTSTTPTVLEGTWNSPCYSTGLDYLKETWSFSGAAYTHTFYQYGMNDVGLFANGCTDSTKISQITIATGTITPGTTVTAPVNGTKLDVVTSTLTRTPKNAAVVTGFNQLPNYCGITNWTLDVASSLMGKTCASDEIYPATDFATYQVFKIEGATLTFGAITAQYTALSEAARPQTWDTAVVFTKQ